jgi:hypothetical protein
MSKIFEALQYAQIERLQRAATVQEPSGQETHAPRWLKPDSTVDAIQDDAGSRCRCDQHSVRIRRQGLIDFLCRLFGLYPWQCFKCGRRFHRFRRYVA